jgi:hypothetical protein
MRYTGHVPGTVFCRDDEHTKVDQRQAYYLRYLNIPYCSCVDHQNTLNAVHPALSTYPKTKLCNSVTDKVNVDYTTGWCADVNRP